MDVEGLSNSAFTAMGVSAIKAVIEENVSPGELWRRLREEERDHEWKELGDGELVILKENRIFLRKLLKFT